MNVQEALELIEKLTYAKTTKHLNDLERQVFIGSWQGQTYEQIYPLNPEYVEKYVGYKLWQKLSKVLGEKVSKKKIRGALERALEKQKLEELNQEITNLQNNSLNQVKKIFISHCYQKPVLSLAQQLCQAIAAAGHQPFMATIGKNSITQTPANANWFSQIETELEQCDYFLLLLSHQTAVSEMVIEELRQVKELRDSSHHQKPLVLTICVNCPLSVSLNHDLRSYLLGTYQCQWNSPSDTPVIVQKVLNFIATNGDEGVMGRREDGEIQRKRETKYSKLQTNIAPPSPVAEPELPKGQVRLASSFYVERVPDEGQCYQLILQPGALIRLKAPRQMGKTSLMARILYQGREKGYRTVPLSFQHADKGVFSNLDQLLRWFCTRIARKLRLPHKVEDNWTDTYGSKDNCTAFFEDYLLSETDSPLVLGLDEVDRVFQYPKIADDFFSLLRAWYEEAGYGDGDSDLWEKLRLVVVHSTEVYIPLDINQSPFNVGLPIELSEFSFEQVWDLTQRHRLNWQISQVEKLMTIVGGHPYLVRLALYHIVQQQLTLKQLVEIAPTEAGIYGDHLRRHLWNLQQHPELAAAFSQVVRTNKPVELESILAFKLHSMGLVHLRGNEIMPRFELYRQYFSDRL